MVKLSIGLTVLAVFVTEALAVAEWGQCGGLYYTGSKTCDAGLVCVYSNDWYSQCLKGTSTGGSTPTSTSTRVVVPSSSTSRTSSAPVTSTTGGSTANSLAARIKAKGKLYFGTCVCIAFPIQDSAVC
ncbi:hypothetical protein FRC14_005790 [Serendipita sp. 396]|nr:hypothetical protein FRC14_005790 [Serendipita sp. 396]KAG8825851.1 hypothetical protein FRC19_010325 [Serendipita sp. 401]KAG9057820.1 hypothetical protein FS842_003895 [Serendipita sp. 407]